MTQHQPTSPAPRKKRRAVFWSVTAIALIAVAVLAYYPERAITPFRVMPDECVIVSENLRLAEKWRERISNPAVLATMRLCGVDEPEEIADDAQLELILNLLCGKRSVLGMVPELGDAGLPGFVGASYVGPRLLPLRICAAIRYVPGIGRIHLTEQGTMYLDFEEKKESDHEVLSLDLREGILLAAWSLDKNAVRVLSARLEGKAAPPPIFEGDTPWTRPLRIPMRAWFDSDFVESCAGFPVPSDLRVEVSRWDSDTLDARVTFPAPESPEDLPALSKSCAALDTLPDAPPIALAVFPVDSLDGIMPKNVGDACAILTRQDMGIPIPAIQTTFPWDESMSLSPDFVARQALLSSYGIDSKVRGKNDSRTLIEIPGISIARVPDADCVAVDAHRGWITITTSATAADNLRAAPVDGSAPWRKGWREAYAMEEPVFYFWADTEAIAEEARRLLSVYRLAATFVPDLGDPEASAIAANISIALDELAAADQIECFAEYKSVEPPATSKLIEVSLRVGANPNR